MENKAQSEEEKAKDGSIYATNKKNASKRGVFNKYVTPVLLAFLLLFIGFFAGRITLDPEMRSLLALKRRIQKDYYEEVSNEEFYKVIFDALNGELLDSYSQYMTADEYAQNDARGKGKQSGVGLVFLPKNAVGEKQLYVSRVCGNSPAEEAGICEGEFLVGFGEAESQIRESRDFDEFNEFLQDTEKNTTFYVKMQSGESTRTVALYKADYVENYVFYRTATQSYHFSGNNALTLTEGGRPLTCLEADAAYIRLTSFNGAAANEFSKAMQLFKTQGKKDLVLDLRGNGGGYMNIMQEIAAYFCKNATDKKPIVAVADYGEKKRRISASGNVYGTYFGEDSRIYVLADNQTASASECLLGAMLDYGTIGYEDICLFTRFGETKTYGKGIMQTTYPLTLTAGDAVKLTTAKILWPVSGNCIHGVGITPENGAIALAENLKTDAEIVAAVETLFS